MKKKVALYSLYGDGEYVEEHDAYRDKDKDWTRLTEIVEVDFTPRNAGDVVVEKVAGINERIEEIRVELETKISALEDRRDKLLAIEHVPETDEEITADFTESYRTDVLQSIDLDCFLNHVDPEWHEKFSAADENGIYRDSDRAWEFYTKDMTPGDFKKALDESGCRE